MKFEYMVNDLRLKSKSDCTKNVGKIKANNTSKTVKVETGLLQLVRYVESGQTIVGAVLEAGKKLSDEHFISQQLFLLDFDNKDDATGEKYGSPYYKEGDWLLIMAQRKGIEPAIIYETFSSKPGWRRYRVGFVLDEPITDVELRNKVLEGLMKIYVWSDGKECLADTRCTDLSRISFGGRRNSVVHKNPKAVVKAEKILSATKSIKLPKPKKVAPKKATKTVSTTDQQFATPLIEAIKTGDAVTYKTMLSKHFENAANPHGSKAEGSSSKGETISLYNNKYTILSRLNSNAANPYVSRDSEDVFTLTSRLPLHELLGLPLNEKFRCILPGHEDKNPSASINQLEDGRYVYNCWSCIGPGKYEDSLTVFRRLIGTEDVGQAIKFIEQSLGINLQSEWQREMRERLENYIILLNSDYFEKEYPLLKQWLVKRRAFGVLQQYIQFSKELLLGESLSKDGRPTFFISLRRASKRMLDYGMTGVSHQRLNVKLNYLVELGLIHKVPFEEMPKEVQIKALEAKKTVEESEGHVRYVQDYLMIPAYNETLFRNAEEILKKRETLRARSKGQSREQAINAHGKEIADMIYTQDVDRERSKRTAKFYANYKKAAERLLLKQKYFTEKQLLSKIRGYSASDKQYLSGQCLPRLIQELELEVHRVNKEKRAIFDIPKKIASNTLIHVRN